MRTSGNDTTAVASRPDVERAQPSNALQLQQLASENIGAPLSTPKPEDSTTSHVSVADSAMEEPKVDAEMLTERATLATKKTRTAVNLRSGPATTFPVLSVIKKGVTVEVVENQGGWSRVLIGPSQTGWIANAILKDTEAD